MSESGKAVFLSYASQDTEAAKRICEALRAAGVEVWFDQSELVGGDAWDQKIRKQIKECALLIPIISAATQARTEGYFRLEWRLADQRTHLMAKGRAFLLPVVIDDTRDGDAHVPDSFTEVQWTRLKGGETPPTFAQRVKKLLDGGPSSREAASHAPVTASPELSPPNKQSRPWLVPVIMGAVVIAIATVWLTRKPAPVPAVEPKPAPASPVSTAASAELARLRARIIPDHWQKGDFDAVSPALDRLLQADPDNADAWALRSIINSLQVVRILDPGTKPLEAGKVAAEHALRLAPESPMANLALGLHLVAMVSRGGDPLASRESIDRAVAAVPPDALMRYAELVSFWLGYDFEGTERRAQAWVEAEPKASYPVWILTSENVAKRRPAEVMKWGELAAADPDITGVRALTTMADAYFYLRADLPATRATLDRIPLRGRSIPRVVYCRWLLAMAEHRWDDVLQDLAQVPDPFLFDLAYNGPKALLAGLAHQRAGRAEAAATQFREAERLLREKLAVDTDNEALRAALAVTLACAGRAAEARSELALVEPLVKGRAPNVYRTRLVVSIAQAYGALADTGNLVVWLRKLLAEPSSMPVTPASLRYDPRFTGMLESPEIKELLKEFASLDQPARPSPSHPVEVTGGSSFAKATEDRSGLPAAPDLKSVAVLAFANLSDDKANEYFSDGISEELLNVLAKVPALKVAARTSSFYFKGRNEPIPEIAKQLGVAYVVEGSVRKAGNKVRITAQLIKAADGFHVWSETYDRDLTDIFAVQDEIAKNILGVVKGSVLGEAELPHATATNLEAYTLYLQAQGSFAKRGEAGLREAIRLYEAALAIAPAYVPALVGLAQARVVLPNYAYLSGAKARETTDAAIKAAKRALELDPQNAAAFAVIGWAKFQFDWQWTESGMALRHARDLAPNDSWTWNCLGDYYRFVGDFPQALVAKQREWDLDPLSPNSHWDLAYLYLVAGSYDQAIHWAEICIGLAPHNVDSYMPAIMAAGRSGRLDLMRRFLAAARQNVHETEGMLLLLEANGAIFEKNPAEARRLLAAVVPFAENENAPPAYLGYCYLLLGDVDQASAWLQKGCDRHDPSIVWSEAVDLEVIAANPQTRPILDRPGLKELYELRQRAARAGLNKL